MQTLRVYNLRIHRIKNAKFPGQFFYMNKNIQGDFQICIGVPLRQTCIISKKPNFLSENLKTLTSQLPEILLFFAETLHTFST